MFFFTVFGGENLKFRYTYTSDQRFKAIHHAHSEDWMLQIKYPQHRDSGIYECQVSTTPHISHYIHLNVIGKLTIRNLSQVYSSRFPLTFFFNNFSVHHPFFPSFFHPKYQTPKRHTHNTNTNSPNVFFLSTQTDL